MIRSRASARSSSQKQTYKSSRAVPPINRRPKGHARSKWRSIKVTLLISGAALLFCCFYAPFSSQSIPFEDAGKVHSSPDHSVVDTSPKKSVLSDVLPVPAVPAVSRSLARGVSGLPLDETPALVGASRGHIECEADVDRLVYWNTPQGQQDIDFKSPYAKESDKPKYITFEPDRGGWNNIRMNLEFMFVFAAATGRILVLPPAAPLYLMNKDAKEKHKGFGDFFPLHTDAFEKNVKVITMAQFLEIEGGDKGQFPIPEDDRADVLKTADECDKRAKSDIACMHVFDYLEASAFVPQFNSSICVVFDEDALEHGSVSDENKDRVEKFCDPRLSKDIVYIDSEFQEEPLIHFKNAKGWRIMAHFYAYMYFTNTAVFNHFKRFVRDFLHYHDQIYCAAGKIVLKLQEEGMKKGFKLDDERGGGFSSIHVRRGDLQYKKVKIPAEEWYENLKETWEPNEIIYIATDERNKTFFDPIKEHNEVRFLDDYWDFAGLGDLDPNYMGMIDTIIASRGRTFGGTFFSTFSGYINRMRGYHGMTMKDSYYSFLPKKTITHEWPEHKSGTIFSHEWPNGWVGIDGEKEPSREKF